MKYCIYKYSFDTIFYYYGEGKFGLLFSEKLLLDKKRTAIALVEMLLKRYRGRYTIGKVKAKK